MLIVIYFTIFATSKISGNYKFMLSNQQNAKPKGSD
jgi:hypothetical protein